MTYLQAKEAALQIASDSGEQCYVADCQIYCDEYEDGSFIVGTAGVFAVMYGKLKVLGGRVVGVADPDGSYFCNEYCLDFI